MLGKFTLAVSEVFYSIQGEGKTMGKRAVFLRLGGCNLMCGGRGTEWDRELHNGATWRCDTIEVWMKAQSKPITEIFENNILRAFEKGAHLIVTGGEPLLQQKSVIELIKWVRFSVGRHVFTEIETNGTITPDDELFELVDQFNVSPKLANSGNDLSVRYNEKALKKLSTHENTQFKFVVGPTGEELTEIKNMGLSWSQICLMPQGETRAEIDAIAADVADLCKFNGYSYSHRLHLSIWDQKTGV